jgi:hypothetical protein
MLHACFALLDDYVEEMEGIEEIDKFAKELSTKPEVWNVTIDALQPQIDNLLEVSALYNYWHVTRPKKKAALREILVQMHPLYKEIRFATTGVKNARQSPVYRELAKRSQDLEDEIELEEQTMLLRLVTIRRGLWV